MPEDYYVNRPLFGGAIVSTFFPPPPSGFDLVRQVPDHQEAFVDPGRDESLIFELLDFKRNVADNGSATWFFHDLASEQDAEESTLKSLASSFPAIILVIKQSGIFEAEWLRFRNMPAIVTTAVGQMAISKGRQGREAQNIVKVYLANLRLKEVGTDVLITAYEALLINHLSESATAVGPSLSVPAEQSGIVPMAEVFKHAVSSFRVNDWSLFRGPA